MGRIVTITRSDDPAPRYHAMVSSSDHEFIEAETFPNTADLLDWLRTRAGGGDDVVVWTDELLKDEKLACQVAAAVNARMPPQPQRPRRMGEQHRMKLMVFPEARRAQVEAAIADELSHRGGTENLTLIVTRLAAGWSVQAVGLGDPVLERGFCDVIQNALEKAAP